MKLIRNEITASILLMILLGCAYSAVCQSGTNLRFTAGRSALQIPIEVENNLILVRASLNGKPPIRMIFDTGASATVVYSDRARDLGLKGTEKALGGATGGSIEGTVAFGVTIGVKGVEVPGQPVALINMQRVPGFDFDGVIGFDFINRFVVEIDYINAVMNLYDPSVYHYRGKGVAIPLDLAGRKTPLLTAKFDFGKGKRITSVLELDTGADNAFLFYRPFVEKNFLAGAKAVAAQGAGGSQERSQGLAKQAGIGPFVFRNVPVFFADQKEGLEKTTRDGIVGGEILRRFKLIIDYSRRRMIVEPNKSLGEAFDVDG